MQQQEQQQQQELGLHHPDEQGQQPAVGILLHHNHHHHHHHHQQQQQQQQKKAEMGIGEEEEEDEDEEDDDPAAVSSEAANMVTGLMGGVVEIRRQQQQQQQQRVRSPGLQMPALPVPCCRVDGCGEDLSTAGDYHRRHKVCKMHATSAKVINHGQEQRFCQQCSRFHSLAEFDEGKRSCRKRLAGHNERRRRHQPESLATTSSDSPPQGRESSKKPREWKSRGRGAASAASGTGGRRGRSGLGFAARAEEAGLILRGGEDIEQSMSKRRKSEMEQVKEGLDLGEGVIIPPLPIKRDGKLSLLKGWPQDGPLNVDELQLQPLQSVKEEVDKRAWQRDDKDALIHCFWDCPKVQPVWRWAGRQLSKLRGSKVKVEVQQAVFGAKLDTWASQESISVWKLLRGIILWQIWLARKGKVSSGTHWTSNKVIRAAWVDLMMYAVQDWLEVLKKKENGKQEDGYELRGKFDSKWLINQFAGRRAEWSMVWKDPDDVLLD